MSPIVVALRSDPILDAIRAGRREFTARFARRDNEEGDAPDWGPWQPVTLHVQLREKQLKYGGRVYPEGQILCVTPADRNWAEYGEDQYAPEFQEFLAEEWRMQLRLDE